MWYALYGTQHLSEKRKKKESKIEEKITNFIELREEIVWLPKRSNCDTPALYKTVLYTAQPVSCCSIGAKVVGSSNLWCHDSEVTPLSP